LKTSKYITSLYAALLISSSTAALADGQHMEFMGNNPIEITFCDTEQAAAQLILAANTGPLTERPGAIAKAKTELKCHSETQAKEYILYKLNFVKPDDSNSTYQILDIIYQPGSKHKFIAGLSVGEYSYTDICQTDEPVGQVNRMEADKDGRLYLKKYMVISKCVNGKSKAVWKALN
jgi:hypothetical protein